MNPWLIIFGSTEDAGKARYAALEKQVKDYSKLHKNNDIITYDDWTCCGATYGTLYLHVCGSKYRNKGGTEKVITVDIYFAHIVQNANRA